MLFIKVFDFLAVKTFNSFVRVLKLQMFKFIFAMCTGSQVLQCGVCYDSI